MRLGERELGQGRIDADDPEDPLRRPNRHADGRSNAVLTHRVARAKTLVRHRVRRENPRAFVERMLDDRLTDRDVTFVGGLGAHLVSNDNRIEPTVRVVNLPLQQDEPAVGLELLEDQVHHTVQQRLPVNHGSCQRSQVVDHPQVIHGRLHRIGLGEDHRVLVGVQALLDRHVHLRRSDHAHQTYPLVVRGDGEEHERRTAADLIAGRQLHRVAGDPFSVDERSVRRVQVTQVPPPVVRRQFRVAAADGAIRERKRL